MLNYQIQSSTLTVLALAIRIADDVKATLSKISDERGATA